MSQLSASDLYAIANGGKNEGDQYCYWCNGKAPRVWKHGEPPPTPFTRDTSGARHPSSPYLCYGCWRFGWKRTTMHGLSGGYKDGCSAPTQSLWITEEGIWIIRKDDELDKAALYEQLLKPPLRFCLMIRDGVDNRLGLGLINDHVNGVQASTILQFTINNIRHEYTPYDLEEGLRTSPQGKPPGVQALMRLFGGYKLPPRDNGRLEKMERGRPKPLEDGRQLQKVLVGRSGS